MKSLDKKGFNQSFTANLPSIHFAYTKPYTLEIYENAQEFITNTL